MTDWIRRPVVRARIELVEANDALRADLERALASAGFEVESRGAASSPAEAGLRHALHVLDLAAPGADVWAADPAASSRSLFLTRDAGDAIRQAARRAHPIDLLAKPFSIERLEARILHRLSGAREERRLRVDPLLETRDPDLARTLERAWRAARQDVSICIAGELGTGRRALAHAIHAASPRAPLPFVAIDGSDFPDRPGERPESVLALRIERARGGTLLVVEPEEWPARAQAALQSALRTASVAAPRCLALARTPLDRSARASGLPIELQYRLAGVQLVLPPLRERSADQADLCRAVARRVARELGQEAPPLDAALLAELARTGFPGNRLGLESQLRSWLIRREPDSPAPIRRGEESTVPASAERPASLDLKLLERDTIVRALGHARGNRTHASHALGISVRTLRNKIREYGLR